MSRPVVLQMQMSLDGYIGTLDGDVAWAFPAFDDEFTAMSLDTLNRAGVHIMGAETGRGLAEYWPAPSEARDLPFAPAMNDIPKVVFSRSIRQLDWNETRVAAGDLEEELALLKAASGEAGKLILVHGGARFVHSLVRQGLIDEYRLMVHPVVLGAGLSLFPESREPLRLNLIEARPLRSGVVYQVFQPEAG